MRRPRPHFHAHEGDVFAGHPTIGTSYVLIDEGAVAKGCDHFLLDEKVGPVPVRVDAGERPMIWLTTPPIHEGRTFDPALCADALGLDRADLLDSTPQLFSAGNPTMYVAVKDKAAVDKAQLEVAGARSLKQSGEESFCVFVFTPVDSECTLACSLLNWAWWRIPRRGVRPGRSLLT